MVQASILPHEIIGQRLRDRIHAGRGSMRFPITKCSKLVLCRAIPRRDVKPSGPPADGRLSAITTACCPPKQPRQLATVNGGGDAAICHEPRSRLLKPPHHSDLARARVMATACDVSSWGAVLDYCHTVMAHRRDRAVSDPLSGPQERS